MIVKIRTKIALTMLLVMLIPFFAEFLLVASAHSTRLDYVFAGTLLVIVIFVFGFFLIDRRITKRIRRLSERAKRIAGGNLDTRILPSHTDLKLLGTDEIDDLAIDLDSMLQKLRKSHKDLQDTLELKENFMRIAGHELRTPLSYIIGMSSMMQNVDDPARLKAAMETVQFKATRLDEIIQTMFKLIPEEKLKERYAGQWLDVSGIIERVKADCSQWIERRNQTLEIDSDLEGRQVYADANKLHDIIMSLAMNAIKFTPDGGIVRIFMTGKGKSGFVITVQDQGPGISDKDMPYIFEPFYSGGDVLKHSTGKSGYSKKGIGLGLAVARHFVELHGGTIEVTTDPTGSTFQVTLPDGPPSG